MDAASSVWDRSGKGTMSKNLFAFQTSFWTAAGIAASMVAAQYTTHLKPDLWFFLGVLASGIIGICIALSSNNPAISLIGYAMVAIPFGLLLGPVVAMYTKASVVKVLFITTGLTVGLGIVGAIIPDNLEGWGSWLFGGLLALLGGMFIIPIAGAFGLNIHTAMTVWDWVGILLFSGYIVYDWNRAMRVPFTADNAIDCALAVYLDFVNIFIRLLELTGTRSDSSSRE